MTTLPESSGRVLVPALMFIALFVAVVGSLGAPLITSVAGEFDVSLAAAQWTLTAPLLVGAIATPVLGRLGTGPRRRQVVLATLAVVVVGSLLTVVPPSFEWLLAGRVAQGVMLLGGVGMYLLLTLVTRYVQTPERVGYGFGFGIFVAGLVLVPFSALGFVGGKLVRPLRELLAPATVPATGATAVLAALTLFGLLRDQLWQSFAVMGLLGLDVGVFSAAMPAAILAVTPTAETASAMSFNQVVRSVGFSIGSALGGLTLAAHTPAGAVFPTDTGYSTASWLGTGTMAVTVLAALVLRRARP